LRQEATLDIDVDVRDRPILSDNTRLWSAPAAFT
jgi:hypothetical protein